MRALVLSFTALALAGCDSGSVPSPTEQQSRIDGGQTLALDQVELRGDGLVAGPEAFYFSAGEKEVEGALEKILSPSRLSYEGSACPSGTVKMVRFSDFLNINFSDGMLVGWFLNEESDKIRVVGDVQVGTPLAEARQADGFKEIGDTAMGLEFSIGSQLGGFAEDGKVWLLYAGTQCFER